MVMFALAIQSWRGKPVRWERISSSVTCVVAHGSSRANSGRISYSGVSHWISG
ncbi:hypothetical protein BDV36DRAFT_242643 [Aspergillus pseudocaelatus]|uniref:Ig-like domain-containing protein n=1 Tax=Aspergillus pseudocaelatus TaxID=1825620 RepID=A0ABQ6X2A8_9EURO|nr:hypothetical protein BDV36DRAFT_242643 [Aspergillus pseudocaelatus]